MNYVIELQRNFIIRLEVITWLIKSVTSAFLAVLARVTALLMRSRQVTPATKSMPILALTAARAQLPAPLTQFPHKLYVSLKTAEFIIGSFLLEMSVLYG